jgi:hypothetical protein
LKSHAADDRRQQKNDPGTIDDARGRALEIARDAHGRARDAQDRVREAQERAVELARQRAYEAQERARKAAEAMPPGLLVRLLSSIIGIPLLVGLVFAEGLPPYTALPFTFAVAVCAVMGGYEFFRGARCAAFLPTDALAFVAIGCCNWRLGLHAQPAHEFLPAILALLVIATLVGRDSAPRQ